MRIKLRILTDARRLHKSLKATRVATLLYVNFLFVVFCFPSLQASERAFRAAAPHLWNELPLQLRTIRSIETFKNSIKTFLFKKSFQQWSNFI